MYRISYMWYPTIGLAVTLIVGTIVSVIAGKLCRGVVRESDPELFTPFLASRIRRRRAELGKTTSSQVFVLETKENSARH